MSTTDLAATIGRNIRAARTRAGLTQGQLATKLGASSLMAVSRWETGKHRPSDVYLVKLAVALGHDVGWFYTDQRDIDEPVAA